MRISGGYIARQMVLASSKEPCRSSTRVEMTRDRGRLGMKGEMMVMKMQQRRARIDQNLEM
jgi:hypothetical protein